MISDKKPHLNEDLDNKAEDEDICLLSDKQTERHAASIRPIPNDKDLDQQGELTNSTSELNAPLETQSIQRDHQLSAAQQNLHTTFDEIKKELLHLQTQHLQLTQKNIKQQLDHFREEAGSITSNLKLALNKFQEEAHHQTNILTKNKGRNMLIVLLFSIVISGCISWLVNKYFPHFIEITKAGNVLIKESNILLEGQDKHDSLQKVQKPSNQSNGS